MMNETLSSTTTCSGNTVPGPMSLEDLFNHDETVNSEKSVSMEAGSVTGDASMSVMSRQTAKTAPVVSTSRRTKNYYPSLSAVRSHSPKQDTTPKKSGAVVASRTFDFNASVPQRTRSTSAGRRHGGGCYRSTKNQLTTTVRPKLKDSLDALDGPSSLPSKTSVPRSGRSVGFNDGSGSQGSKKQSISSDPAVPVPIFASHTPSSTRDRGTGGSENHRSKSRKSRSLSNDRSSRATHSPKPSSGVRRGTRPNRQRQEEDVTNSKSPVRSRDDSSLKRSDDCAPDASTTQSKSRLTKTSNHSPPRHTPKRSPKRSPVRARTGRIEGKMKLADITPNDDTGESGRPTLKVVKNMTSALLLEELDQMDVVTLQRMHSKIKHVIRTRSLSPSSKHVNSRRTQRGAVDIRHTKGEPKRNSSRENADLADIILSMNLNDDGNNSLVQMSVGESPVHKSMGHLRPPSMNDLLLESLPDGDHPRSSATTLLSNFGLPKPFFRKETNGETSTNYKKRQIALLAKSKGFLANLRANMRSDDSNRGTTGQHHSLLRDDSQCESDVFYVDQMLPRLEGIGVSDPAVQMVTSNNSRSTIIDTSDHTWGSFDPTMKFV